MKTNNRKINVRTVRKLQDGEGLTLKSGRIVTYKTGWQVAFQDGGIQCKTPEQAMGAVRMLTNMKMRVNVGVWFENGVYYVDISKRVTTKAAAVKMGVNAEQISIYSWYPRKEKLLYLGL